MSPSSNSTIMIPSTKIKDKEQPGEGCFFYGSKNERLITNDFISGAGIYTACFLAYNQTTMILSITVRTIDDRKLEVKDGLY